MRLSWEWRGRRRHGVVVPLARLAHRRARSGVRHLCTHRGEWLRLARFEHTRGHLPKIAPQRRPAGAAAGGRVPHVRVTHRCAILRGDLAAARVRLARLPLRIRAPEFCVGCTASREDRCHALGHARLGCAAGPAVARAAAGDGAREVGARHFVSPGIHGRWRSWRRWWLVGFHKSV